MKIKFCSWDWKVEVDPEIIQRSVQLLLDGGPISGIALDDETSKVLAEIKTALSQVKDKDTLPCIAEVRDTHSDQVTIVIGSGYISENFAQEIFENNYDPKFDTSYYSEKNSEVLDVK